MKLGASNNAITQTNSNDQSTRIRRPKCDLIHEDIKARRCAPFPQVRRHLRLALLLPISRTSTKICPTVPRNSFNIQLHQRHLQKHQHQPEPSPNSTITIPSRHHDETLSSHSSPPRDFLPRSSLVRPTLRQGALQRRDPLPRRHLWTAMPESRLECEQGAEQALG